MIERERMGESGEDGSATKRASEPRSVSIVGEIIFHWRGEKSGCSRRGKDSRDACWSLRFAYESHGFLASISFSLFLSRLAENSSPFRREGKRWRCCLGRFRVVNTINEGAFNGCTSSREAEKGDGGILGIARLPSGAICMCNWMLETMLSVSFDVDSWGLRDFLAFHRVL